MTKADLINSLIFWPGLAAWTLFVATIMRNAGREEGRAESERDDTEWLDFLETIHTRGKNDR